MADMLSRMGGDQHSTEDLVPTACRGEVEREAYAVTRSQAKEQGITLGDPSDYGVQPSTRGSKASEGAPPSRGGSSTDAEAPPTRSMPEEAGSPDDPPVVEPIVPTIPFVACKKGREPFSH